MISQLLTATEDDFIAAYVKPEMKRNARRSLQQLAYLLASELLQDAAKKRLSDELL